MKKNEVDYRDFKKAVLEGLIQDPAITKSNAIQNNGTENEIPKTPPVDGNKMGETESGFQDSPAATTPDNVSASQSEGEKIEKRGRHKKDCTCANCQAKKDGGAKAATSLNDTLGKYKRAEVKTPAPGTPAPAPTQPQNVDLSKFISGALFLILLDAILPKAVITIAGFADEKYKGVDTNLLKLDSKEKKELEPLADEVVKFIFGYVHPAVAFLVVAAIMYGSKLMEIDELDFEDAKEKRDKKRALKEQRMGGAKK